MRRNIVKISSGMMSDKSIKSRSKRFALKMRSRVVQPKELMIEEDDEVRWSTSLVDVYTAAKWLFSIVCIILLLLSVLYSKTTRNGINGLVINKVLGYSNNKPVIHRFRLYSDSIEEGNAWDLSWREAGWHPVILNIEDAIKHPMYKKYMSKLESCVDEIAWPLYIRYIAMANVKGGGWLVDVTVYPLHLANSTIMGTINSELVLPNKGEFTSHDSFVPSLFSASEEEWERLGDLIIQNARNPSDLHALKHLLSHDSRVFLAQNNILRGSHIFKEKFQKGNLCCSDAFLAIRFAKPDIPSRLQSTPSHHLVRQWFHIYFHRCLLQYNINRPIIYTYFEPMSTTSTTSQTLKAIHAWKQIWYTAGWLPLILNENDAKRHPAYPLFISAFTSYNNITLHHRHKHSFLRWLAVASSGGGWIADYDVLPIQLPPKKSILPYEGKLTVYAFHTPCLVSGSVDEYYIIIDILYNTIVANMPTPYFTDNDDTAFFWNDMLALQDIYHTTGAFNSLQQVINLRQVYNQDKCDLDDDIKAIHFSPYDINLLHKQKILPDKHPSSDHIFLLWYEEWSIQCSHSRKPVYFDDQFNSSDDNNNNPHLGNLRILTLGSSTTWGATLHDRYGAYPYLLSSNVTNIAIRGSGPNYPSICTQSLIGDDIYDVIILEYFSMVYDGLIQLVKRLRQRFPDAILIYMMIWNPTMIGYHDKNDNNKWHDPQLWSKQLGFPSSYMKSNKSLKALSKSNHPWQFTDRKHLQNLKNIVHEARELGNGYIYEWDMDDDNVNARLELLKKANYFAVDWLHLSKSGHEVVAQELIQFIQRIKSSTTTNSHSKIGTWGSGDTCFFWYENGIVDPLQLQYSNQVKLVKFSKAWNKVALEVSRQGGWIKVNLNNDTNRIGNGSEMRQIIITYMVTNADHAIYPKVQVEILGGTTMLKKEINPVIDTFSRPIHVTSSSSIGLIDDSTSEITISITPLETKEAPFRVVSIAVTGKDAIVSDNFGGGDDINWSN